MALGTNHLTNTTHDNYLPEIWSNLIVAREQDEVMAKLVTRVDQDVANGGDVAHFPKVSSATTTAVSDETAVTFQATTEGVVNLSLNRHFESSFALQDKLRIQSKYDVANERSKKSAQALIDKYETDLTGLYSGLTQTKGTGMTALTEALIVAAIRDLDNAKAPQSERYLVLKPDAVADMRQIARFTEYQTTGDGKAPMVGGNNGFVKNAFGVDIHMTTNIASVAGTPGIVHNLLFHRSAFALAIQQDIKPEHERKSDWLADVYVTSALWGFTEMRDDHAVDIRTVIGT